MSDDKTKEAVKLDTAICICNQKATTSDKLIKCHSNPCMNGKFFHLTCMNYKRKPNNAKTTWICPNCSAANLYDTKTKIKVANSDNVKASTCNSVSTPNNGNLNNRHFKRILSPTGWLDDDIILEVHINLKKIDPTMQGLQDPILGPVRQFRRVGNPFVQILYTGNYHWVCISSVGCSDGIVNLYDSLYHNVISKEVEEQALNLVGADSFSSLNVVPIQQQRNGSDCGVFAAAFATALVHGVPPSLLEFDTTKVRNHLCECLKAGKLEMFPLL